MAFLFLIIDILVVDRLVVERDILVCYVVFYRHFAMQRAGYDSLFLGFGVRNIRVYLVSNQSYTIDKM